MIEHLVHQKIDYSFIMAPFYFMENDHLLKSQLLNLNLQTDLSFEVIIPDPHYKKRDWLKELTKELKYNLYHFPYKVNTKVPKTFDYGIFNTSVLMSNSDKIITFQDWRFCDYKLVETLKKYKEYPFVGFLWQVLYKDTEGKSTAHSVSTIDISEEQANEIYNNSIFPDMKLEIHFTDTFGNKSWGHYCVDKELWMELNGIDEVATNTRHYADLDLNVRFAQLYKETGRKVEIPMIKNGMVRIMHNKGKFFGNSNVELDIEVNQNHLKCCFSATKQTPFGPLSQMNDKKFNLYVVDQIEKGEFTKIYQLEYSEEFKINNKDESLDSKNATIGFMCNKCKVIGETPHWYRKSPGTRTKAMHNIGFGDYRIGRNLNEIEEKIKNKTFEEKVEIVNTY